MRDPEIAREGPAPRFTAEHALSLEAAVALTGVSKRTLWRRVSSGAIAKISADSRGRALLSLPGVLALAGLALGEDDRKLLVKADDGDPEAQANAGAMLHLAGAFDASIYWLRKAAAQENPEAMQWLGICYAGGKGVARDDHLALMWLARSAALGHVIAQRQLHPFAPG